MDEYVRTFVDSIDSNNNVKNRDKNSIQQQVTKKLASELEQGNVSQEASFILGQHGIEEFNKQLQSRKEKNVFMEQAKIENAEIMKAIKQNPELNIITAKKEIEQKNYSNVISEVSTKIQTEISSTRRANVAPNQSNTSVETHIVNSGTTQEPITSSTSNNSVAGNTVSGGTTQEPIISGSSNDKAENPISREIAQEPVTSTSGTTRTAEILQYSAPESQEPITGTPTGKAKILQYRSPENQGQITGTPSKAEIHQSSGKNSQKPKTSSTIKKKQKNRPSSNKKGKGKGKGGNQMKKGA